MQKIIIVILIYLALCLFIFLMQRKLEYLPHGQLAEPKKYGFNEAKSIRLSSFDQKKLTLWHSNAKNRYIILYFHGNAGNLGDRANKLAYLHRNTGYDIAAISYRGYPGSEGKPSELAFHQDAEFTLKYLVELGYKVENIILYGESLGSAMAIKLAGKYSVKAIFLEAPFWSASSLAKRSYWFLPIEILMLDKYESYKFLSQITSPVYLIHGTKDKVTPINHSRKIYNNLPDNILKRKTEISGADHLEFPLETLNKELINFIAEINAGN